MDLTYDLVPSTNVHIHSNDSNRCISPSYDVTQTWQESRPDDKLIIT